MHIHTQFMYVGCQTHRYSLRATYTDSSHQLFVVKSVYIVSFAFSAKTQIGLFGDFKFQPQRHGITQMIPFIREYSFYILTLNEIYPLIARIVKIVKMFSEKYSARTYIV